MPTSRFRSFQQTPVLFLTARVSAGLPLLADDAVHAILRDVWLQATVCDRWFVGEYWILPDRISLFASPGQAACAQGRWETRWRALSAFRINAVTGGSGRVWEEASPSVVMDSETDYWTKCEAMRTESFPLLDLRTASGRGGMMWQLLGATTHTMAVPFALRGAG